MCFVICILVNGKLAKNTIMDPVLKKKTTRAQGYKMHFGLKTDFDQKA